MSSGISGSYDGEGPNVAAKSATAPGPVTKSPDVWAQQNALGNNNNGGQGRTSMCRVDRVGRLRTDSEAARSSIAINVSGGDQVLPYCSRMLMFNTSGTFTCRLADDTVDITFADVPIGFIVPVAVAIVRQAGTTATGYFLF